MADAGMPDRALSAATLKEGVDHIKRQQVKLERAATEEEMEKQLEDGLIRVSSCGRCCSCCLQGMA